jgi:hypothetical protein
LDKIGRNGYSFSSLGMEILNGIGLFGTAANSAHIEDQLKTVTVVKFPGYVEDAYSFMIEYLKVANRPGICLFCQEFTNLESMMDSFGMLQRTRIKSIFLHTNVKQKSNVISINHDFTMIPRSILCIMNFHSCFM